MGRDHPFTVAEMISALQELPPDMRVMVRGCEGGYHDASGCQKKHVVLNVHDAWYYGPHEDPGHYLCEGMPTIEVALI